MTEATLAPAPTETPTVDPSWSEPMSKGIDRCDKCKAQAYVRTIVRSGEKALPLTWCQHHFRQYEEALLPVTLHLHDERDKINLKPSSSANV